MITKTAHRRDAFRRVATTYPSARAAFRAYLAGLRIRDEERVLLPGYIGWSIREGSGVFDPVRDLGLRYGFYRMGAQLRIDIGDLERQLAAGDVRVVVLVHYFGYVDPCYHEAVTLAERHDALVLEDEAHAMLTDVVGQQCGRLGDAAIFSLHKLLPLPDGGVLVRNHVAETGPAATVEGARYWEFDLAQIASARRRNARLLAAELEVLRGQVDVLWTLDERTVPQTLPVIVRTVDRDRLYAGMNAAGFGVVSLYHTMLAELPRSEHPDAYMLAGCIMNLPIHQDVTPRALRALVDELRRQVHLLEGGAE